MEEDINDFTENSIYTKYMNLIRFNTNLSHHADVGNLETQSPDYILEKYDHWIGFEPNSNWSGYTPDNCQIFLLKYSKRWGKPTPKLHRILIYLYLTKSMKLLQMVELFETYIGKFSFISNEPKGRLHELLELDFIPKIIEMNKKNIQIIIRDEKINLITNTL